MCPTRIIFLVSYAFENIVDKVLYQLSADSRLYF